MTPFTLCAATSSGNAHNNHYPNHHQITDQAGLEQVARLDHVAATYTNDRRSSASFISSDCVVMDIDNDHTEESSNWVTPEKLAELMAGVVFMTATSRNHQKAKGVLSARPRFHVYFPITEVTDADTYTGLKRRLAARFGFFDQQALDAGRFIYGTTNPETTIHNGDRLLDAWLDEADEIDVFAAFDASTQVIGEGSRNATLSRFAGRVLIRYGQTAQARDLFDRKASLCEPPLGDHELESIWGSACRFAAKVEAQPGYLSLEAYAELTSLRPDDFTDVGQASMLTAEYSSRLAFTEATDWLVYEGGVWSESAHILKNPSYTGDLLLGQWATPDGKPGRAVRNSGELPMYLVENAIPTIIDRDTFTAVQAEITRRRDLGARANWAIETVAMTSKIKCATCGCSFVRNRRNPKTQNQITTEHWICTERKKGRATSCGTSEISDTALKAFIASVLGIDEFDDDVFTARIDHIDVTGKDHYTFHYTDGTTSAHTWRPNLKRSSWTPAKKAAWAELVKARWDNARKLGIDGRSAPAPPEALAKYRAVAKAEAERLRAERGER